MIPKKFSEDIQPPDELISKANLIMWLADYQLGTNPYTDEGKKECQILEGVLQHVADMKGVPVIEPYREDGEE